MDTIKLRARIATLENLLDQAIEHVDAANLLLGEQKLVSEEDWRIVREFVAHARVQLEMRSPNYEQSLLQQLRAAHAERGQLRVDAGKLEVERDELRARIHKMKAHVSRAQLALADAQGAAWDGTWDGSKLEGVR